MVPGQAELHVGVAVNSNELLAATVGMTGLRATEARVTAAGIVTVITPEAILVTPFNEALTKIPSIPATDFAVKRTVGPEPVSEPRLELERDQTYAMDDAWHVGLHVGVAVRFV
jgi:hypothetical protein